LARRGEAVDERLGGRPAEGDDGLTLVRAHGADEVGGRLASGLHGAGMEHRLRGPVRLEAELAVVVTTVAAEATGEPATPRPLLAGRRVLGAGAHVCERVEQRVRRGMREAPGDEHVLV